MVDEKKNENVNQENAGKINNYGLIELINFLNRFKTISSNQSNDKVQIRAMGHIVWKDQPKKKSMETAKNMNVNDSKDVEEKTDGKFEIRATEFEIKDSSFDTLAEVILTKLNYILKHKKEQQWQIKSH